ncbi:MAG: hypothetical protein ABIW49_04810 [Knoellia sp.]
MRVLISAGWLGGAGGAERALHSIARALDGDTVDIVVRGRLGGAWAETPASARIRSANDYRWYGAGHAQGLKGALLQRVANPIRRFLDPRFDVHLQFLSGAHIAAAARANVRLVIPSGNSVPESTARLFDAVAMQAPDNQHLVPVGGRGVLLPPPVFPLATSAERPPVTLPGEFVLTVFNPYDRIKGMQDLERALDESPLPLVWCHSQATVRFDIPDNLLSHPRIIHVVNASPAELRFLYEQCSAYVSFSLTEGFGWSAADALRYSPAVATRRIGVFSNEAAWQPGTLPVADDGRVEWDKLLAGACSPALRDLTVLDGETFRQRLIGAVSELHE